MSLKDYQRKRHFGKTAEPVAKVARRSGERRFVIQKHAASRLHYDFRLELGGTLKSWAVPKGMPFKKGEKRLAVQVEDHPVAYRDFEGPIPKGEYGGGTVMVWDHGTFEPLSSSPLKELQGGKLHFILHGTKLEGEWYLVRLRDDESQWLLIRGGSDMKPVSKKLDDTSSMSGRNMKALALADPWVSQRKPKASEVTEAKQVNATAKKAAMKLKFIEPMKAKLVESAPNNEDAEWIYEIKFDGYRALALKHGAEVKLISRTENDLTAKFADVAEAVGELKAKDCILDGEIVALDAKGRSSFQRLQAYELSSTRPALCYYVFDLLRLNGKGLMSLKLTERKARLKKLVGTKRKSVLFSESLEGDVEALLKEVAKLGLEGLIGKRKASTYEAGKRSGAWIKLKITAQQEFVIGGYTPPSGSRKHFGALIVGVYSGKELQCVGKVGTGFNEKLLKELHSRLEVLKQTRCPFANLPAKTSGRWGQGITASEMKKCTWVKPTLVCQLKFSEWTTDSRLRQPVFLGLREDKKARAVVREKAAK